MKRQRRKKFWKTEIRYKLFNFFLIGIIIVNLFLFYILWDMSKKSGGHLLEQRALLILSLGFIVLEIIFLTTILVLLHRALGPFQRMEEVLEKVLQGDYSCRLTLRKKDIIRSFTSKLNKIFDLLEKNK